MGHRPYSPAPDRNSSDRTRQARPAKVSFAWLLHGHAGGVPAIAGKLNLVSGTFAVWAAIFATLFWCAAASRVCALVLRFRLLLFGDFLSNHCRLDGLE